MVDSPSEPVRRRPRRLADAALWAPGLVVGVAAAVVTAHGLYGVAAAAGVPPNIAWLYPLITDGLGLVAYSTTHRLGHRGIRYAWCVVVLAAGLSGVAQAAHLADGATVAVPTPLRFGVGAWPAVAAAIVAHLIYLLGESEGALSVSADSGAAAGATGQREPSRDVVPELEQLGRPAAHTSPQPSARGPSGRVSRRRASAAGGTVGSAAASHDRPDRSAALERTKQPP